MAASHQAGPEEAEEVRHHVRRWVGRNAHVEIAVARLLHPFLWNDGVHRKRAERVQPAGLFNRQPDPVAFRHWFNDAGFDDKLIAIAVFVAGGSGAARAARYWVTLAYVPIVRVSRRG
jgi:hypothetical protein